MIKVIVITIFLLIFYVLFRLNRGKSEAIRQRKYKILERLSRSEMDKK